MPTILEICWNKMINSRIALPGKSFCEVLTGGKENEEKDVVVFDEYGPVRMIETKNGNIYSQISIWFLMNFTVWQKILMKK